MTRPTSQLCPQCGLYAVPMETGVVLEVMPTQVEYRWWCRCGYLSPVRYYVGVETHASADEEWQAVNAVDTVVVESLITEVV